MTSHLLRFCRMGPRARIAFFFAERQWLNSMVYGITGGPPSCTMWDGFFETNALNNDDVFFGMVDEIGRIPHESNLTMSLVILTIITLLQFLVGVNSGTIPYINFDTKPFVIKNILCYKNHVALWREKHATRGLQNTTLKAPTPCQKSSPKTVFGPTERSFLWDFQVGEFSGRLGNMEVSMVMGETKI